MMTDKSTIQLSAIATARSGDKGNHANIGVVAFTKTGFDYLREQLTEEEVAKAFASLNPSKIERYELPKVWALNFVLYNALGGGAGKSLQIDTQGKLLGTAILEIELPKPPNLEDMTQDGRTDP